MSLTIFTTSGQFIVYKYLSNRSKNNPTYLYNLKKILETMSYCFSTSLMDHTTMIIISKFIFSLFESPKHPKFDLNHLELKIICPNFVQSIATQGSRSCQFPKPKQTFSWMKQKKVKKNGWFWETRWQTVREQQKSDVDDSRISSIHND